MPEVHKRRLYEKKDFGSIFEFAFKLAGLSEQQVRTTLNLEKRFFDKPVLRALLENGEVSVNKLVRIQSIATSQHADFRFKQATRPSLFGSTLQRTPPDRAQYQFDNAGKKAAYMASEATARLL